MQDVEGRRTWKGRGRTGKDGKGRKRRTVQRIARVAGHDAVERDLRAYQEDEEGDGGPEDFLVEGDLAIQGSEATTANRGQRTRGHVGGNDAVGCRVGGRARSVTWNVDASVDPIGAFAFGLTNVEDLERNVWGG